MKLSITTLIFLIRIVSNVLAQTDTIPPATPANIIGLGYEKDLAVEWYHNQEPDLAGYNIYSKSGNGYHLLTTVPKEKSYYSSTVPVTGIIRYYKLSAYDLSGN